MARRSPRATLTGQEPERGGGPPGPLGAGPGGRRGGGGTVAQLAQLAQAGLNPIKIEAPKAPGSIPAQPATGRPAVPGTVAVQPAPAIRMSQPPPRVRELGAGGGQLALIHISEPKRTLYTSYAGFCLKKKNL